MLSVFARPEACPPCYCVKFNAGGAIWFFVSVGVAGEDSSTVATNAAWQPSEKNIAKLRENIARVRKAKRLTGKMKTAAGTVKIKISKKTWMMQLPHRRVHGL